MAGRGKRSAGNPHDEEVDPVVAVLGLVRRRSVVDGDWGAAREGDHARLQHHRQRGARDGDRRQSQHDQQRRVRLLSVRVGGEASSQNRHLVRVRILREAAVLTSALLNHRAVAGGAESSSCGQRCVAGSPRAGKSSCLHSAPMPSTGLSKPSATMSLRDVACS